MTVMQHLVCSLGGIAASVGISGYFYTVLGNSGNLGAGGSGWFYKHIGGYGGDTEEKKDDSEEVKLINSPDENNGGKDTPEK